MAQAFDGSDPCWVPTLPVKQERERRLRVAKFGDGYQQRIVDGINSLETTWSLSWDRIPNAELNAMDAYLQAQRGAAFDFEHPVTKVHYAVFCDKWQISWDYRRTAPKAGQTSYYGSMEAEFTVAFGVTVTAIVY